jgi:uncharacterized membrane protein
MRQKLDYIYYRFYRFQVSVGNGQVAVAFSLLFFSFLLMVNVQSVMGFLYAFAGIKVPYDNPGIIGLTIIGLITFINMILFIYRQRYKSIIKRYKDESKDAVRTGNIYIIVYMILTFVMFFVGLILMMERNRGNL